MRQCGRDIVAILARQSQRKGRTIFRQQDIGTVVDLAARSENFLLPQQVALSFTRVIGSPVNLKKPKPGAKHHEQQSNGTLQQDQPGTRRLVLLGIKHEFHDRTCG